MSPDQLDALVRRYYQNHEHLGLYTKFNLFSSMYLLALIGDLCTIFGSTIMILSNYYPLSLGELFIGFGAFCSWVSITKYLANTKNYYVIMRTFYKSIPLITKVWIGILPIYIGLCFLSIAICWEFKAYFGSFP